MKAFLPLFSKMNKKSLFFFVTMVEICMFNIFCHFLFSNFLGAKCHDIGDSSNTVSNESLLFLVGV